jgi:hypothetical protein
MLQHSLVFQPSEELAAGASTKEGLARHPDGDIEVPMHWVAAARIYAAALRSKAVPGTLPVFGENVPQIVALRADVDNLPSFDRRLKEVYRRISPGDVVIVDAGGVNRQSLARALFDGGFDGPMLWAGRRVLRCEAERPLINRLLSGNALGAGPRYFPGLAERLEPAPDRVIAMARRSPLPSPDERLLSLSVVIPVYNERSTFREVIDRVLEKAIPGIEIEICIVESNSTDGTREEVLRYAEHPRIRLILEDKPSGKGHAVRAGLAVATGDFVLIQDADLEYDLDDYEKLLSPLQDGTADFVLGSRHRAGERVWNVRQFSDQPTAARLMNLGHLIFAWMLNATLGKKMRDPFTMFKVFRRDAIHNVRFMCNRFDFDIELVAKLIRQGYHPLEVDIAYNSRSFNEGKKVSILRDPPTWVRACLKHRFSTLHTWPEAR